MGLAPKTALKKAIQADILSLISWQIGMYIWMAIVLFGILRQRCRVTAPFIGS